MILQVTSVKYLHDYQLWLRFKDDSEGVVNLDGELCGALFDPLRDLTLFSQAKLDKELATVVWPNGADLAPEFLHALLK
ncbi:DUF2442 domain-containing protein [Methylobacter sp.]|uniref:DUF2442 domain-containing protein n=1 Tax=Methylobacter sp. TaxID=2051955 RepID=UPI002FDD67D5